MREPKQFHDVVGYYNRFDVFDLKVNRKRLAPIAFVEGSPARRASKTTQQMKFYNTVHSANPRMSNSSCMVRTPLLGT